MTLTFRDPHRAHPPAAGRDGRKGRVVRQAEDIKLQIRPVMAGRAVAGDAKVRDAVIAEMPDRRWWSWWRPLGSSKLPDNLKRWDLIKFAPETLAGMPTVIAVLQAKPDVLSVAAELSKLKGHLMRDAGLPTEYAMKLLPSDPKVLSRSRDGDT